jgi:type I restriction enzyme S subunit
MWAMNSENTYQQVKHDTVGATSPRINIPTIANAWMAVPPESEQALICAELARQLHRAERVKDRVEGHLRLLRQYRQALITEAVAGKREIPVPSEAT